MGAGAALGAARRAHPPCRKAGFQQEEAQPDNQQHHREDPGDRRDRADLRFDIGADEQQRDDHADHRGRRGREHDRLLRVAAALAEPRQLAHFAIAGLAVFDSPFDPLDPFGDPDHPRHHHVHDRADAAQQEGGGERKLHHLLHARGAGGAFQHLDGEAAAGREQVEHQPAL